MIEAIRQETRWRETERAARTAEVVLGELATALTWGETHNITDLLSGRLAAVMNERSFEPSMGRFSPVAFFARTAEQEGVDVATATYHVKLVLQALEVWLPPVRIERMREELPLLWRALEGSKASVAHPAARAAGA